MAARATASSSAGEESKGTWTEQGRQMRASVLLLLGMVLALGLGVCKAGARGKGRRQQKRAKPKTRAAKKVATQRAGTPFVLQLVRSDNWLCFAGDGMRRCGANTVWHQVQITSNSAATNLQLHSTPPGEAPVCLVRKSCDEANSPIDASTLTLGSCNQSCSSMAWGIENDDFSQSVIVFNNTQHCAAYNVVNNTFHLDACIDAKYAPFLMQSTFTCWPSLSAAAAAASPHPTPPHRTAPHRTAPHVRISKEHYGDI